MTKVPTGNSCFLFKDILIIYYNVIVSPVNLNTLLLLILHVRTIQHIYLHVQFHQSLSVTNHNIPLVEEIFYLTTVTLVSSN